MAIPEGQPNGTSPEDKTTPPPQPEAGGAGDGEQPPQGPETQQDIQPEDEQNRQNENQESQSDTNTPVVEAPEEFQPPKPYDVWPPDENLFTDDTLKDLARRIGQLQPEQLTFRKIKEFYAELKRLQQSASDSLREEIRRFKATLEKRADELIDQFDRDLNLKVISGGTGEKRQQQEGLVTEYRKLRREFRKDEDLHENIPYHERLYGLSEDEERIVIEGAGWRWTPRGRRWVIRQELFNSFFSVTNKIPTREFEKSISFTNREKINAFLQTLELVENPVDLEGFDTTAQLAEHYSTQEQVRQLLHNANFLTNGGGGPEQLAQFLATFKGEYLDLLYNRRFFPGVGVAVRLYEEVLDRLIANNAGAKPFYREMANDYAKDHESILEKEVRAIFEDMNKNGLIRDHGKNPIELEGWHIDRALAFARGISVVTLRFAEKISRSRLPQGKYEAMASLYGNDIARIIDPLEHFIYKYGVGEFGPLTILTYFIKQGFHEGWIAGRKTGKFGPLSAFLGGLRGLYRQYFWDPTELRESLKPGLSGDLRDRTIEIFNLLGTGGPFKSSWRLFGVSKYIPERNLGFGMRLLAAKERALRELSEEYKVKLGAGLSDKHWEDRWRELKDTPEFAKAIKDRVHEISRGAWLDTARSNPNRILLEYPEIRVETLAYALGIDLKTITDQKVRASIFQNDGSYRIDQVVAYLQEQKDVEFKRLEGDLSLAREKFLQGKEVKSDKTADDAYPDLLTMLSQDANFLADAPDREERIRRLKFVAGRVRALFDEKYAQTLDQTALRELQLDLSQNQARQQASDRLETLAAKEQSLVLGLEDAPVDDYDYMEAGGTALIARRMNDFMHAAKAMMAIVEILNNLQTFDNPQQIVGALKKVWDEMESYNPVERKKVQKILLKGIIKFGDKSALAKLPFGIGYLFEIPGNASYAQMLFGRKAFSIDESGKRELLKESLSNGLVDKKIYHELLRETQASWWWLLWKYLRLFQIVAMIALLIASVESYQKYHQETNKI